MARLPRYYIKNQPQHIILQGRDGQSICFEEQDYQYFHDCLDAAAYNYNLKLHAYVIMPNHAHVLATPGNSDSVSRMVQFVGFDRLTKKFSDGHSSSMSPWTVTAIVLNVVPAVIVNVPFAAL